MPETVECSRCGTPIAAAGESLPPFCPTCGAQLEAAQVTHEFNTQVDYELNAPPVGSKIEILEATHDRLMLSIPAGGKRANSLGCFGIIWLLITGAVTAGFTFGAMQDAGDEAPGWFLFLFLSVFWLVGIVMLSFAARMKYSRGYLFLSKDRAVHQRILFGRKSNSEISLEGSSYAHLVESYQENDVSVYRIEIEGVDGKIKYGTGMEREQKEWYVETINQFIAFQNGSVIDGKSTSIDRDEYGDVIPSQVCPACGQIVPDDETTQCASCGASLERSEHEVLSAHISEEISPESLPHDFPMQVSRSSNGDWEFLYPMRKMADNFKGGGCLLAFGAMWETFIIFFTGGVFMTPGFMKIFMLLFTIPFHLVGIGLTTIGLFTIFGGFRLRLGSEKSSARWGVGPIGYTRRFSTSSITEVKLIQGQALSSFKKTRHNRSSRSRSEGISCILMAAGKRIPVTSGTIEHESRTAAGLIRYCLHDLGHRLQDE